ncbi:hypothetical protein PINS_up020475 [Pythium insidiosum]|nr:hypothetical protein PINS_up020475 [Pythium insidiosum]
MIQVARTGRALSSLVGQDTTVSAVVNETLAAQRVEDQLAMQLIALFGDVFSSVLHHAMALQLHETTPIEVRDARLAYLSDRLDELEGEYLREQEEGRGRSGGSDGSSQRAIGADAQHAPDAIAGACGPHLDRLDVRDRRARTRWRRDDRQQQQ